jgi:Carboxypeptidase regulatory-like domain/TonB dependent receptor
LLPKLIFIVLAVTPAMLSAAPLSKVPAIGSRFAATNPESGSSDSSSPEVTGSVSDSTNAVIPDAQVQLLDANGAVVTSTTTGPDGEFILHPPRAGDFTVTISRDGFETSTQGVRISSASPVPLHVVLAIGGLATQVTVNSSTDTDLTDPAGNQSSVTMSASDLKQMPVFDNDYVTALSAFMDSGQEPTAGSGLMVDGVEANRVEVSPSAVQEVHINQDPYSAQYYNPGRGQMEIITKSTVPAYHGQFNFTFRDNSLNAQQDFSPSKPFEQRRIYEGFLTGPIGKNKNTSFLFSANRAEEDLVAVVNATIVPTPGNPSGIFQDNVPAPTRDTEFSLRIAHQFGQSNNAYVQYAYQDSTNTNEGAGNQTLAQAAFNAKYREDDLVFHDNTVLSAKVLNQASLSLEHWYNQYVNAVEGPRIVVQGNFTGGSAQNGQLRSEYNARFSDKLTWVRGAHTFIFGVNVPHFSRRVIDDHTNSSGTYTFSSLASYEANQPSGFSMSSGQVRFVFPQQEIGMFFQDEIKVSPRFSVTPGVRYDWQNFLSGQTRNFSPRFSFALVLDPQSDLVLRGGGGVYYDRPGGGPLQDMARYGAARRQLVNISSLQEPLCMPITLCLDPASLPPSLVERAPGIQTPYSVAYGFSIDRRVGQKATASINVWSHQTMAAFRSVDINAPTPPSYQTRPNSQFSQVRQIQSAGKNIGNGVSLNYRGFYNKYFTGFGQYTWSKWESNTDGISWFPENQFDPNAEWSKASWDQRQRFGLYGMFNQKSLLNLGAGLFFNTGRPWSILTGEDNYGTGLFNARPEGIARNSETGPGYADLDLRWGYDFKLRPADKDDSPTLGLSASSFNVLNHVNGSYVDNVQGSEDFAQVTSADPPRRMQIAMRFIF